MYCVRSWTLCNSLSWFGSVMVSSTNIKALWMNNLLLYNACIKIDWICIHLYHDLIVPALYFKIIYSHWHRAYMDLFNYYYRDCHEIFFCLLTHISLVPPTFLGHSSSPQARHNPCELMAFSTIALHIDCRWRLISLIDVPKKRDFLRPRRYSAKRAQKTPQLVESPALCDEWRKDFKRHLLTPVKVLKWKAINIMLVNILFASFFGNVACNAVNF